MDSIVSLCNLETRNMRMGVILQMTLTVGFITIKGIVYLCSDLKYSNYFSSVFFLISD